MKPHKAPGHDDIPPRLLRDTATSRVLINTIIFQASLKQEHLPNDWKTATVVPIFKKGSCADPYNDRPIFLNCMCCKLLKHIIYSLISTHLISHKIICKELSATWI